MTEVVAGSGRMGEMIPDPATEPSVVSWCEPPPKSRVGSTGKWQRFAEELKARPGEWALVLEDVPTRYATTGAYKSLRRVGCEATTRTANGVSSVWARWPA